MSGPRDIATALVFGQQLHLNLDSHIHRFYLDVMLAR